VQIAESISRDRSDCRASPAIRATSGIRRFPRAVDNILLDRGAHRVKFGAYYFHLQFRPEQPDNARGAFTYTGQFSGNAFADFLLGYPTTAVSGIGRGAENGRTNWLHLYAQDDRQMRPNLTLNLLNSGSTRPPLSCQPPSRSETRRATAWLVLAT
jgi:hypothetical protein